MQAGHASIPARAARGSGGGGRGLKRKLELRPKRHALIFGGIPSSELPRDTDRPKSGNHLAPPSGSGSGQPA